MKNLIIEETKFTPLISLNINGTIDIVGKSYPENTFVVYTPLLKWVKKYFDTAPCDITTVNFEITYYNSSSSKIFFQFFSLLNEYSSKYKIVINWIYDIENERAEESGEEFVEDFDTLDIQLICK